MSFYENIHTTAAFIKEKIKNQPQTGIILGSGLSGLIDIIEKEIEIPYSQIPNFPVATVEGHDGKLVFGKIGNQQVMLMAGRFHYYEGYSMQEVTFPIRVMKELGVTTIIVSNAAGGTNPGFAIGDLMIIKDHINLFPEHPLRGSNDNRLGVRFLDMSAPYDKELITLAKEIAAEQAIQIRTGVYIGIQGPTFETPAEYKWLHTIGGDAVCMSTVPEIIVARHCGMKVFAISVITDLGVTDIPVTITHQEVLEAANAAAPKMAGLVERLIKRM